MTLLYKANFGTFQGNLFWLRQHQKFFTRYCSTNVNQNKPHDASQTKDESNKPLNHDLVLKATTKLDKYVLVFTGRYKSVADVPNLLSPGIVDNEWSKGRIKFSIYMMIASCIGFILAIRSGKAAAERGETISWIVEESHRKYDELDKIEKSKNP